MLQRLFRVPKYKVVPPGQNPLDDPAALKQMLEQRHTKQFGFNIWWVLFGIMLLGSAGFAVMGARAASQQGTPAPAAGVPLDGDYTSTPTPASTRATNTPRPTRTPTATPSPTLGATNTPQVIYIEVTRQVQVPGPVQVVTVQVEHRVNVPVVQTVIIPVYQTVVVTATPTATELPTETPNPTATTTP